MLIWKSNSVRVDMVLLCLDYHVGWIKNSQHFESYDVIKKSRKILNYKTFNQTPLFKSTVVN
jgi:hypothetical protein